MFSFKKDFVADMNRITFNRKSKTFPVRLCPMRTLSINDIDETRFSPISYIANRVHGSFTPALPPSSFEKYHRPVPAVVALPHFLAGMKLSSCTASHHNPRI